MSLTRLNVLAGCLWAAGAKFLLLAFISMLPATVVSGKGTLAARSPSLAATPNTVLILADDMGWGDPQCYNLESENPTPNIDKLASEEMRFTDAHTSAATCAVSRYALLTGHSSRRIEWRSGTSDEVVRANESAGPNGRIGHGRNSAVKEFAIERRIRRTP